MHIPLPVTRAWYFTRVSPSSPLRHLQACHLPCSLPLEVPPPRWPLGVSYRLTAQNILTLPEGSRQLRLPEPTAMASVERDPDVRAHHAMKRGGTEQERKLNEYLISHSARDLPLLQGLYKESLQHERSVMVSPPDSIPILQLLLRLTSAKVAIEVGTFTGFTALGMALALPEGGKLYTLDITREYPAIGFPHWREAGVHSKIEFIQGPAVESLDLLLERLGPNSADLAFIDADKPNYDNYYEQAVQLVRSGGVIVIDNVLWSGNVVNEADQSDSTKCGRNAYAACEKLSLDSATKDIMKAAVHERVSGLQAIRAINDKVFNDSRVQPAMFKNSDGITVAYKL